MKKFFIDTFKNHTLMTTIFSAILLMSLLGLYKMLSTTKVHIEFKDLRPFHEKAPVYFKGFKIGKVTKIEPTDNYQSTLVTVALHPKNLNLPLNTTAKLKVHKTRWLHKDYIELIYPDSPDLAILKNGSKIAGKSSIDIHSYLANISPDSYEKMEENAANILENLDDTTGMLYSVFAIINSILTDNEAVIKNSFSNLEKTTKSTSQMMQKIDNAVIQADLNTTLSNIYTSTDYIQQTLKDFSGTPKQLTSSINQTNCLLNNLNEITCGLKNTMKKRFAGIRLIFGRPIQKNCICK